MSGPGSIPSWRLKSARPHLPEGSSSLTATPSSRRLLSTTRAATASSRTLIISRLDARFQRQPSQSEITANAMPIMPNAVPIEYLLALRSWLVSLGVHLPKDISAPLTCTTIPIITIAVINTAMTHGSLDRNIHLSPLIIFSFRAATCATGFATAPVRLEHRAGALPSPPGPRPSAERLGVGGWLRPRLYAPLPREYLILTGCLRAR